MILDNQLMLSDAQAVTNTQASTNYIDLGSVRDIGVGEPLELTVKMGTAALSGGSSTLVVALQTDTASGFGTAVTLAQSASIPKASMTLNADLWKIKVPEGVQRYLRLNYTVGTADLTAGTISAFINLDRKAPASYPSGLNTAGY